jgi:hypothetical protein
LTKEEMMVLTPREIAAMARRGKDFDDLMLELAGISGRTPRGRRCDAGAWLLELPAFLCNRF